MRNLALLFLAVLLAPTAGALTHTTESQATYRFLEPVSEIIPIELTEPPFDLANESSIRYAVLESRFVYPKSNAGSFIKNVVEYEISNLSKTVKIRFENEANSITIPQGGLNFLGLKTLTGTWRVSQAVFVDDVATVFHTFTTTRPLGLIFDTRNTIVYTTNGQGATSDGTQNIAILGGTLWWAPPDHQAFGDLGNQSGREGNVIHEGSLPPNPTTSITVSLGLAREPYRVLANLSGITGAQVSTFWELSRFPETYELSLLFNTVEKFENRQVTEDRVCDGFLKRTTLRLLGFCPTVQGFVDSLFRIITLPITGIFFALAALGLPEAQALWEAIQLFFIEIISAIVFTASLITAAPVRFLVVAEGLVVVFSFLTAAASGVPRDFWLGIKAGTMGIIKFLTFYVVVVLFLFRVARDVVQWIYGRIVELIPG